MLNGEELPLQIMSRDPLSFFYKWENRVPGELLDFTSIRQWIGWTGCQDCKVCKAKDIPTTYEVEFEWGDTQKYEYISDVCYTCLKYLAKEKLVRNAHKAKIFQGVDLSSNVNMHQR